MSKTAPSPSAPILRPYRGAYCQFLESDLRTPLPRKLNFTDVAKVAELVEGGRGFKNLENRHAFDLAVEVGRGGIYLELTEEKYRKLK